MKMIIRYDLLGVDIGRQSGRNGFAASQNTAASDRFLLKLIRSQSTSNKI